RACCACSIRSAPPPSTPRWPKPSRVGPSVPPPSRTCSSSAAAPVASPRGSTSSCPPIPACATSGSPPTPSAPTMPCWRRRARPPRSRPMTPLTEQLTALGLRETAAHLDDVVALATKRRWSPTQLLEHLVTTKQQERTRRSLERRLARSRLGRFTPMSDFDWAWPKRPDRAVVEAVLRLDFLAAARNVLLVAAQ